MEKVTIIIPAYNAEETVGRCVDSVLRQTYKNIEVLIVNDGSTDRTRECCEMYKSKDTRIHIYNQENQGVSGARNLGIEKASGKYIQFVDCDDYIEENMVEKLVEKMNKSEAVGLVSCGCVEDKEGIQKSISILSQEELSQIETLRAMLEPDSIRGFLPNKLFMRDVIEKYRLRMRENIHVCEDLLFCLEYAAHISQSAFVTEDLYHYVYRNDSVTHKKYSPKRFTTIEAFEEIKKLTAVYTDKSLDKKVEAHYLVLIIQLFVMLKRNKYAMSSREMKCVMENMKKRKLCLWGTNWDFKYKIVSVPIKILSMIYG